MSAYQPPTEDVPIFDSSNFYTNLDNPLTIRDGLKYFLSYPNAQGTENFIDTNTSGIGKFSNNLQTSFLSGIVGGGTFYIDGDEDGADIVITTKKTASKLVIQNDNFGTTTPIATFELNEYNFGVITGYLNGTSNSTYSVLSPGGTPNGSIMYSDGNYSQYISTTGTTDKQALCAGGTGVTPYWGDPEHCTSSVYADNISGGSLGKIPYQSSIDTTIFTTAGVAGQCLISGGGVAGPTWSYNLGNISSVTTINASGATNYMFDSTNFNKINYFTGSGVRNIVLPVGTTPPPDGTFLILQSKNNASINVYSQLLILTNLPTDAIIASNLINTIANPGTTNQATNGGQYVFWTTTGWIKL
jgi:hypothetical protein